MAKRHTITGIDIGSSKVRVVVSEYIDNYSSPIIIGTGIAESRGIRHGYITNNDEASESIRLAVKQAERNSETTIKNAFVAVGGISVESETTTGSVFASRADSVITNKDIENAIAIAEEHLTKKANREIIQSIPVQFKIDSEITLGNPQGMKGSRIEATVLFITCLSQHLDEFISAVEKAGVSVEDVLPSPIVASFVTLNKRQRVAGCALANIGAETLSLAVFENDVPISIKIFPIGGTEITNDIALGLKIPLEDAEEIKIGAKINAFSKKKVDDIITARLSDIFDLINSHLKKINRQGLLPAGIVISGGTSLIPSLDSIAKEDLNIPSKIASPDFAKNTKNQIYDSHWAVAYGLTIIGIGTQGQTSIWKSGIQKNSADFSKIINSIKKNIKQFLP